MIEQWLTWISHMSSLSLPSLQKKKPKTNWKPKFDKSLWNHTTTPYIFLYTNIYILGIYILSYIFLFHFELTPLFRILLSLSFALFLSLFDLWLIGDLVDFIDIFLFCSLNCSVYGYNYLILLLSSYNYLTISSYISNHFMSSLAKVKANWFLSLPQPESDNSYTQIHLCRQLNGHPNRNLCRDPCRHLKDTVKTH